jgi:glycosyltransferase involved in cell wall biosynthesis
VWNGTTYRNLRRLLAEHAPQVAHFHNTFPLVSPAGFYAARDQGVAVVQTLHNYRLVCPNAQFFREQRPCEDCSGKLVPWPGVVHACYRRSRRATAVTAAMLALHRAIGTWTKVVDVYIALTEFARGKFIENGIPPAKIMVKPNFVSPDPGIGTHGGNFALYVGRVSTEKGVGTLLDAWRELGNRLVLKVVGDGPLERHLARSKATVEWLGSQPRESIFALMQNASFLVFPSECYETFGVTLVEAFATGLPVIASGHGSAAEIVKDGETGRHFRPGDATDLAAQLDWAITHTVEMAAMGRRARQEFESKYTAARNYELLMDVYRAAVGQVRDA